MSFMRRIVLLMILVFSYVLVNGQDNQDILQKKVSLQLADETVKQGLFSLQEFHQVNFSYVNEIKDLDKKKTVFIKDLSLDSTLALLFVNTNITYYSLFDQVILVEKEISKKYNLDLIDSISSQKDTVKIYSISYLNKNNEYREVSVASLWQNLFSGSSENRKLTGFVNYDTLVQQDTVKIYVDSVKQEKPRSKIKFKDKQQISSVHRITFISEWLLTYWSLSSPMLNSSELSSRNDYGQPDNSFNFGVHYHYNYGLLSVISGIEVNLVNRKGTHEDRLINRSNNNSLSTRYDNYSSNYTYFGVPLMAGINLTGEKLKVQVVAGGQAYFLISEAGPSFFPDYQDQYYDFTPNLLYDEENKPIVKEEIQFNDFLTGIRLMINTAYAVTDKLDLGLALSYRSTGSSIYEDNAPVKENFNGYGIGFLINRNF